MRVRNHKHLQLLGVPLVPFVGHPPPLLPGPTIHILELNRVVQIFRRDVHRGSQNGVLGCGFGQHRFPVNGFPGPGEAWRLGFEVGGDGPGHAVAEDDEQEKEKRDREADSQEVGENEVAYGQSAAGLSGELGFGGWGAR